MLPVICELGKGLAIAYFDLGVGNSCRQKSPFISAHG